MLSRILPNPTRLLRLPATLHSRRLPNDREHFPQRNPRLPQAGSLAISNAVMIYEFWQSDKSSALIGENNADERLSMSQEPGARCLWCIRAEDWREAKAAWDAYRFVDYDFTKPK